MIIVRRLPHVYDGDTGSAVKIKLQQSDPPSRQAVMTAAVPHDGSQEAKMSKIDQVPKVEGIKVEPQDEPKPGVGQGKLEPSKALEPDHVDVNQNISPVTKQEFEAVKADEGGSCK